MADDDLAEALQLSEVVAYSSRSAGPRHKAVFYGAIRGSSSAEVRSRSPGRRSSNCAARPVTDLTNEGGSRTSNSAKVVTDLVFEDDMEQAARLSLESLRSDARKRQELADHAKALLMASAGSTSSDGKWDCKSCTLVNSPSSKVCKVCGQKAPSSGVSIFFPVSKQVPPGVRFGCELEMFLSKAGNFSRKDVAFNLTQAKVHCVDMGYSKLVTPHWKIVTDSSLKPSLGDLPFELVSPILSGEEGVEAAAMALRTLCCMGICTNETTGFHLHVDGAFFKSLAHLKNLVNNWLALESAIEACVPAPRRAMRNRFAWSNRAAFGQASAKQRFEKANSAKSIKHLRHICSNGRRLQKYLKLNLETMGKSSPTVEFRLAGGTDEPEFLEFYIRFVLLFCEKSESVVIPVTRVNANDTLSPREEVTLLLEMMLGACPATCQTYLERVAAFGGVEQNAWKCLTCQKTFEKSRQLLQHCHDSKRCRLRLRKR